MDAVEFLKAKNRMCKNERCEKCSFRSFCEFSYAEQAENAEDGVAIVEQWAKKHPVKTRQSEFLKIFPNARTASDGMPDICPIVVDKRSHNEDEEVVACFERDEEKCRDCRRGFWMAEIKDGES